MRIDFLSSGSVIHTIPPSQVEKYEISGQKLISDDYFMNEPASVRLTIIADSWLLEHWESDLIKIGDSIWFLYPVQIFHKNILPSFEQLLLTGLMLSTDCEHNPFEHRMQLVFYDYTALLTELDVAVRIYYPFTPATGTDWTKFILNYQLPGEGENEAPEDDENPSDDPQWFPYLHSLPTPDRQLSSVLQALTQIWAECYALLWELNFNHAYEQDVPEGTPVNNYIVNLGEGDSFYNLFVSGLVAIAYNDLLNHPGLSGWQFWANYGFLPVSARSSIYQEYSLLLPVDCDGYFVMRAGYTYLDESKDYNHNTHPGWTDGEGGGGGGGTPSEYSYYEWYRIFAIKKGLCVLDTGRKFIWNGGYENGQYVAEYPLSPANLLPVSENSFYRCTENDFYNIPPEYAQTVLEYFYSLTYFVYYTGLMDNSGGYIGNRIFKMKNSPQSPGQEQFIEQKLRDWFKTMLFIGDLTCFADETGLIQIVPRSPLDELSLPFASLLSLKKKLLIYQPWDKAKLGELIADNAEISYLIEYYGGSRILSNQLELTFALRYFTALPLLRQTFTLPANINQIEILSLPTQYIITEVTFVNEYQLKICAVRSGF